MVLLRLIDKKPDSAIQAAISKVVSMAQAEFKESFESQYPKTGFGIAELAPYHVNSGGAGWTNTNFWGASIATSNTWQDWINITLTDQAFIINTGFFDREANPIITHLRPRIGGEDMPAMNIEQFSTLEEARIFYEAPFSVKPSSNFTMRVKADNTGQERIGLMGYCLAKRAFLIREL